MTPVTCDWLKIRALSGSLVFFETCEAFSAPLFVEVEGAVPFSTAISSVLFFGRFGPFENVTLRTPMYLQERENPS